MSPNPIPRRHWDRLIAHFRDVPQEWSLGASRDPVTFTDALQRYFKQNKPHFSRQTSLGLLRNHWTGWFQGTAFAKAYPYRLDRADVLWLKTSDPICRQRLQFQLETVTAILEQFLPGKIKEIRLL